MRTRSGMPGTGLYGRQACRRGRITEAPVATNSGLGVIALVPDAWEDIVMPRHQVLQRLAKHFPVIWVEPAQNWRQYILPFGPHFLSRDRWSEPASSLEVLSPGWRHPRFHRPRRLEVASFRSRLALARRRLL